jgi:hydrogenase maturation protease
VSTLVIAVGNVFRGDDGVGPELAGRVRALDLPRAVVVEALGDVGLIDAWTGHDSVILLDAVHSGAAPGTVIRRDLVAAPLPRDWFRLSSHQLGVADAIELARTMRRLPERFVFVGIEGERFDSGVGLSPCVAAALDEATRLVAAEMSAGESPVTTHQIRV